MADQTDPVPRGPLTALRPPAARQGLQGSFERIADGNGEIAQGRRDWRATEIVSTKDLASVLFASVAPVFRRWRTFPDPAGLARHRR
jgi:hypothetical protein